MKKILLVSGIMMSLLPAMADDPTPGLNISDLYQIKTTRECSGDAFQVDTSETPLQMAAVYVDGCASGTYLNVANDASIGSDGTLSGVSCETCLTGNQCSGVYWKDIKVESDILLDDQGIKPCGKGMYADVTGLDKCKYCAAGTYQDTEGQPSCKTVSSKYYAIDNYFDSEIGDWIGAQSQKLCPTGYQDGDGASSIYGCQKRITTQMCDTYAENFQTGNMTTTVPSGDDALVNYRDISNHCFGSLTCKSGYKTKQNLYQWMAENAGKIESVVSCPISGKISVFNPDTEKYEDVDCNNGQEPGTTKFVVAGNNSPMASINFVAVCSDKTADTITSDSADYDDLTAESTGSTCYRRNIDFPNQPWNRIEILGSIFECEERCLSMNGEYPFGRSVELNNGNESLVVKDSTDNYYAKNGNQFFSLIMIPENTCYDSTTGDIKSDDYTTSEACAAAGYKWNETGALYWDAGKAPVNSIGDYTAVADEKSVQILMELADLTESDTNAQVCTPDEVHITWTGVTLDANDPANTCTYGGALITPNDEPEQENSLFLGWKVVETSATPQP